MLSVNIDAVIVNVTLSWVVLQGHKTNPTVHGCLQVHELNPTEVIEITPKFFCPTKVLRLTIRLWFTHPKARLTITLLPTQARRVIFATELLYCANTLWKDSTRDENDDL